jgi:hypothetical protein
MNNLPFYYITNKVSNLPIKMDKIANEYGVMVDNKFLGVRYYEVENLYIINFSFFTFIQNFLQFFYMIRFIIMITVMI